MSLSDVSTDTISRLVVIGLALAVLTVIVLWALLSLVGQLLAAVIRTGSRKWYASLRTGRKTFVASYILRPLAWLEEWVL